MSITFITRAHIQRYTFEVAPVFTLMENELVRTFCKMFGFENGDGIFAPGGSISNMYEQQLFSDKMSKNRFFWNFQKC